MNFEQPPIEKKDLTAEELEDALKNSESIGPQMSEAELIAKKEKDGIRELQDAINSPEGAMELPDDNLGEKGPENLNSLEEQAKINEVKRMLESNGPQISEEESEALKEENEIRELQDAINSPDFFSIKVPDDGLENEEEEQKKSEGEDSEIQAKINEIKKTMESNERAIKNSEDALEEAKKGGNEDDIKRKQKTLDYFVKSEKVKLQKDLDILQNKNLELKDNLDILEGKKIDSIDSVKDKEIIISKVKMKAGESSEVDRGKEFSGFSPKKNITVNDRIFLEKNGRPIINTSRIKSIKECKDGSYIVETGTSFYRLSINA